MYQSILVPIDGSDNAQKALEIACKIAASAQSTIYLLNVPELPPATDALGKAVGAPALDASSGEAIQSGLELIEQTKQAEQSGRNLIERIRNASGLTNIVLETVVKTGSPAEVILDQAAELGVEAIVMGSRGMSDWKGLVIGSVSHKVMHTANCAVILVKDGKAGPAEA
ncbi:MAG: universal stress protein [Gammaproteobacteria bacterium]